MSYNIVVTNDDDLLNIEDYIKQYIDSIKRQDGCNQYVIRYIVLLLLCVCVCNLAAV